MQRILICTNHFYPETFRCNDVAFELTRLGYDVTVLTAIPDYPGGKFFDGYGFFRKRKETVRGVKVIRAFTYAWCCGECRRASSREACSADGFDAACNGGRTGRTCKFALCREKCRVILEQRDRIHCSLCCICRQAYGCSFRTKSPCK